MFNLKNIVLLSIFAVILSFIINFALFFIFNNQNNEILGRFAKKIVSNNYLSVEPFLNRGSLVESFEFLCQKKECIPFKKQKLSNRKIFIDQISQSLSKQKILFVPMSLADTYQLLDLRYYINNPLFVDTKSLGMSYYAKEEFFNEFIIRFSISFQIEECHGLIKNYTDSRIAYNKRIKDIIGLSYDCKNSNLNSLIENLKKKNVGYLIEYKNFLSNEKIIFCDERDFCLYEL